MQEMVQHKGFVTEDVYQNLDTLRIRSMAYDAVEKLDNFLQKEVGDRVSAAYLTRSGHYGMSLLSDSIFIEERYQPDFPDADEASDMDICILLEDGLDAEVARRQFRKEDGEEGRINEYFPHIEINPRILEEGDFVFKLDKAQQEWRNPVPESISFPSTDGDETMRRPAEFIGYFHQGYFPVVSNPRVEDKIEESIDSIRDENGNFYDSIEEEVWGNGDFEARMEYKPRIMKKNFEMGLNESAKRNSERLDFSEYNGRGGLEGLAEELKMQIIEETNLEERLQEDFRDPLRLESPKSEETDQYSFTEVQIGVKRNADPESEVIRRKSRRFLDNHPDLNNRISDGQYIHVFGNSDLEEHFGDDYLLKMPEDAAKRYLGVHGSADSSDDEKQMTFNKFC